MLIEMDDIERISQKINIQYVENTLGKEEWTYLSKGKESSDGISVMYEWVLLIEKSKFHKLKEIGLSQQLTSRQRPGFICRDGENTYCADTQLYDGIHHIVHYRAYHGLAESSVELSQEFILLLDLRFDKENNKYFFLEDNGEWEDAVIFENSLNVKVKTKFLRRYTAAKQLYTAIGFYYRECSEVMQTLLKRHSIYPHSVRHCGYVYDYITVNSCENQQVCSCSILQGQVNIPPAAIEKCGFWPYDQESELEGERFIVGVDDNGLPLYSKPLRKGIFRSLPHSTFLTPVYFKKEVLQKYYAHPEKYKIEDGCLRCGYYWSIAIDLEDDEYVNVYLGDLARDLPMKEHKYWASYCVTPRKGISKVRYTRDVCAEFANPEIIDLLFKQKYLELIDEWKAAFSWSLYRKLAERDEYRFSVLRLPIVCNQPEFDNMLLCLCIILIDYLNEEAITKEILILPDEKDVKGISKLEKFFTQNNISDYNVHIKFLRDIYKLRSKGGSAHGASSDYAKCLTPFKKSENDSFVEVFKCILEGAESYLSFLSRVCSTRKAKMDVRE